MLELNQLYNMDCMDGMAQFPDKYFELAIVDPPYGDVPSGGYMTNSLSGGNGLARRKKYNLSLWKQTKPDEEYFHELFRISQNQIIWGGNYFCSVIRKDTPGWIVWNKLNGDNKFSDCELAWTSFYRGLRLFEFRWSGMLQGNMSDKEIRIHPTQKPVALYEWLLAHYAHPGDKILDTHVGSASSLIACHRLNFDYIGFELDPEYWAAATERLEAEKAQTRLF